METSANPCPRCREPLAPVLAQCYSWTPTTTGETFLVLGLETLYRCMPCSELFFSEEVALPVIHQRAA